MRDGPGRVMDRGASLSLTEEPLINLFRDIGQVRRQQLQDVQQGMVERPLRRYAFGSLFTVEPGLYQLQVVIAQVRPEEALDLGPRCRVLALLQLRGRVGDRVRQS